MLSRRLQAYALKTPSRRFGKQRTANALGGRPRRKSVPIALREIVALRRFKDLMKKYGGKLSFAGHRE